MKYSKDVKAFQRYILLAQAASILLLMLGLLFVILFFAPSLLNAPESYKNNFVWLSAGIFFISVSLYFIIIPGRWSSRLIRIMNNVVPKPMSVVIESEKDSDHTSYYALLSGDSEDQRWKVNLFKPSWDTSQFIGAEIPADVYYDPELQKPVLIKTSMGILWSLSGKSSIEAIGTTL
jgi:hypothetical protein